ncbi:MAG TPA: hypothetical protein VGR45_17280 [Stellaceae bacterium]|nr:hypothetical protein [Stellaceae bacterium]
MTDYQTLVPAIERLCRHLEGQEPVIASLARLTEQVDGVRRAIERQNGQLAEHLRNDEAAHARQDDRIAGLKADLAEHQGAWRASIRWAAFVSSSVGGLFVLAAGFFDHWLMRSPPH